MKLIRRAAAIATAAPYIWLGYEAAKTPGARKELVANAGLPSPDLLVRLNGAAMVGGGLALAVGFRRRQAALLLIGSMLPTTYVGHAFWKHDDSQLKVNHRIQFLKNIGLIGGLLAVVAATPKKDAPSRVRRQSASS
jgi:uncharacterized membrane protein YphA (DoxX/SURF4 family)